jgi:hypothetical protein
MLHNCSSIITLNLALLWLRQVGGYDEEELEWFEEQDNYEDGEIIQEDRNVGHGEDDVKRA